MSRTDGFEAGFLACERAFFAGEAVIDNPYDEGTEEWAGWQEAAYIFTQK